MGNTIESYADYAKPGQLSANVKNVSQDAVASLKEELKAKTAREAAASKDTVSISDAAQAKYDEAVAQEAAAGDFWKEELGLEAGTTTLKNGNRQVVTIDGTHMELREYAGDKLVRAVDGDSRTSGVSLDTRIYDANGRVSQSIHTELNTLIDDDTDVTRASVRRDIQWFDNGELTRSMNDAMYLSSHYEALDGPDFTGASLAGTVLKRGMESSSDDLDSLAWHPTEDTQMSSYKARVAEYTHGRLARETSITQNASHVNDTNRTTKAFVGQAAWTTKEMSHDVVMSMDVKEYDSNGDMLRTAAFTDKQVDGNGKTGGRQEQELTMSWYNQGELVKSSTGSLSVEETAQSALDKRQSLLQVVGMTEDEYATVTPQSATEILGAKLLESSEKADFYGSTMANLASSGRYGVAQHIADFGSKDQPYSAAWSDTYYRDGEVAARREDRESAVKNPAPQGLTFRTGGALSEDETPAVLRRTSHEYEAYEDGKTTAHEAMESHETMDVRHDGPDAVITSTHAEQGTGFFKEKSFEAVEAPLVEVDKRAAAASSGMGGAVKLAQEDLYSLFARVRSPYAPEQD